MAFKKKNNKKQGQELPEIIKKYNIRISTPNGCFPEDVDKVLEDLEKQIKNLSSENQRLEVQNTQIKNDFELVKAENQKLRFQIMNFNYEDTSELQDFNNLAKLTNINPSVGTMPAIQPVEPLKAEIPLAIIEDEPPVFDDYVTEVPQQEQSNAKPNVKPGLADIYNSDGTLDIL